MRYDLYIVNVLLRGGDLATCLGLEGCEVQPAVTVHGPGKLKRKAVARC